MSDTADLNLVLGRILPDDALHQRAKRHLGKAGPLLVPFSVRLELLFVAHRFDFTCVEALGAAEAHFEIEAAKSLYSAAEGLDSKRFRRSSTQSILLTPCIEAVGSTRQTTNCQPACTRRRNSDMPARR